MAVEITKTAIGANGLACWPVLWDGVVAGWVSVDTWPGTSGGFHYAVSLACDKGCAKIPAFRSLALAEGYIASRLS